jgi:hypothetical protein
VELDRLWLGSLLGDGDGDGGGGGGVGWEKGMGWDGCVSLGVERVERVGGFLGGFFLLEGGLGLEERGGKGSLWCGVVVGGWV